MICDDDVAWQTQTTRHQVVIVVEDLQTMNLLRVVLILQSFQIRRAIMLNFEHSQRLERSAFPCCYYSDVACKLEHTKVRMRKGLAKDLHHFRDGITVTTLDPEVDGQGNGPGTVAIFSLLEIFLCYRHLGCLSHPVEEVLLVSEPSGRCTQ